MAASDRWRRNRTVRSAFRRDAAVARSKSITKPKAFGNTFEIPCKSHAESEIFFRNGKYQFGMKAAVFLL